MSQARWLQAYCNQADLDRISLAVKKAEQSTSGEIVPMIVHSSCSRAFIPMLVFLILSLLGVLILDLISLFWWAAVDFQWRCFILFLAALVAWFFRHSDFLLRWLTPKMEIQAAVHRRAQFEFYESHLQRTLSGTGFLIFVSLAERRVVVLGDENISRLIPESEWDSLVNDILSQVKKGNFTQGLCDAIAHSGQILTKYFPRPPINVNELPNHLVVKE